MEIKQKKGISLIVLVITIIVMIILAAAIILSLNSSGIIGKANEATKQSNNANLLQKANVLLAEYELAKQMGDEEVKGKTATEYVQAGLKETYGEEIASGVVVTKENEILVGLSKSEASVISKGIMLGDYVGYMPTVATSTESYIYDIETEWETGMSFSTQTGESALKWRYMGINETGEVLLIADRATTDALYLEGATGYLQGPNKINKLCEEIYSSEKGTARSITVEDVNRILEANPVGRYLSRIESGYVDNPEGLTIGEIISQKGEPELTSTETPDGKTDINTYVANYYEYMGTKYKANTTDEYKLIFQNASGSNIMYWLSSSCVDAVIDGGFVGFHVREVRSGQVSSSMMFDRGQPYGWYNFVRPVVILNSDVQFGTKTNGVWSLN